MLTYAQAFANWREVWTIIPNDEPANAESWNDYTDSVCKDGEFSGLQYHYCPAWDDEMPDDDREFILQQMNVTMSATFVPFSQSRNRAEKEPSLNWRVTLLKDGKEVIVTDYMQGFGHCPAYKNPSVFPGTGKKRDEYTTRQRIRQECETGKVARVNALGMSSAGSIPTPDLSDVVYSLLSDASALDSRDFADWCAELGYSDDSITARKIYDACIEVATKLRAAFGQKTVDDLRELFQDY